jgi:DNA polymerase-3 subunit beta
MFIPLLFVLLISAPPLGLDLYRPVPAANPLTKDKVALGRRLISDRRLSRDGTVACATCHDPKRAFTDGRVVAVGVQGRIGPRNVPTLVNRVWGKTFFLDGRAADFPTIEDIAAQQTLEIEAKLLQHLLAKTHFSMAQQDVRYYLNGLLLEPDGARLRGVATDGHRLALAEVLLETPAARSEQLIVPRKGVLELSRLLDGEGKVRLAFGANHVRAELNGMRLTSKLIDGRFPDYGRVIPNEPKNVMLADRNLLKQALQRTAILSNEKYRGVRLQLGQNSVILQANNPEQEEAIETVELEYDGDEMEIGFNVNYLLDALMAIDGEQVRIGVTDGNSSCLITEPGHEGVKFVVMPMRL